MRQTEYRYPSFTGVCEIAACTYQPDDGIFDAVLVINHGMAEHQQRYLPFIEYLCAHGTAVYMHDMASHGNSCSDLAMAGWFGERDGYKGLVADFRENVLRAKRDNPGKKIIAMGHSMGSFICRLYTVWHPEDGIDGAVYMGTGGPNPAAGAGIVLARIVSVLRGKKHRSGLIDSLAFGSYNKRWGSFNWLTRDSEIVKHYVDDPYCGFMFPVQGMIDLMTLTMGSNSDEWYGKVPKDLPILLISGEMDPVGDYGKGIEIIRSKLMETGHTHLTTKVYPECRHEVLNELNRADIQSDILQWIRSV